MKSIRELQQYTVADWQMRSLQLVCFHGRQSYQRNKDSSLDSSITPLNALFIEEKVLTCIFFDTWLGHYFSLGT